MTLNFNVSPYYDDFDPTKNFHRILFKPGVAVQARELTQAQTILQNQISDFAGSIFSQNTPVSGGKVTTNLKCNYIKLNFKYNNAAITASDFIGKTIQDTTGTILAKVIATAEAQGSSLAEGDPPTLIVSYISGTHFTDGMLITPTDGTNLFATSMGKVGGKTSVGNSSVASISNGVFYVITGLNKDLSTSSINSKSPIGNFVNVVNQTIILGKYDDTPSVRIGLEITETIHDYIDDPSLLDPAIGASNYQAPGADRYVVSLSLIALPLTYGNDSGFIELVRMDSGSILKQVDGTVYSTIDDYFAKRTYDTNGDYIVNPFTLTPKTNSDSSKFDINIGKGVAYVRGYRLENQSSLPITSDRARTTKSITGNSISVDYGNYFFVDTVKGTYQNFFDITTQPSIDFHSVPVANIVSTNANTYNSTLVGSSRIRNLTYDHYSDVSSNTSSYVYKAHVSDVSTRTLTGNASSATVNTITFPNNGLFSTKDGAYKGVIITIDSGTSSGDTRKITSYIGSTRVATVDLDFSVTPDTSSNFSLRFGIKDIETLVSANASYAVVSSANINNISKKNNISTGDVELKETGFPEMIFDIGHPYVKTIDSINLSTTNLYRNQIFTTSGGGYACQITMDTADSSVLTFKGRTSGALTASEILNYYTVVVYDKGSTSLTNGQILDFTASGRTVNISNNGHTITFFAPGTDAQITSQISVNVICKVNAYEAVGTSHLLKTKTLITPNLLVASNTSGTQVNTNTYVTLKTDSSPYNAQVYIKNAGIVAYGSNQSLYVSDVKNIVKIIDTGSPATLPTVAMLSSAKYDVTSNYNFNNGQTDNYYDHAYITLKPGAPSPDGNLLVLFNYYNHGGGDGYFNINSYLNESYAEIRTYTAKNGQLYQLRDCLDFRPARLNASSNFTFRYTDPGVSQGLYIPDNVTSITNNYSYYLGRKDLLVLTKDRMFDIIKGIPSENPAFPNQPDGSLLIAKMNLDPYTGYIPGENPVGTLPNLSLLPVLHKRWTMQDISDLQTRVNNLEYYTALNALEMKADSTQVPDVNGLNRFKNGILVDDFSSFSTADTKNVDWSANINKRTRELSARTIVYNFPLQNQDVLKSKGKVSKLNNYQVNNINGTTNLITLPYTTANVVTQQLASNTINLNPFAVTISEGILELNPPMDNWVDNEKAPDLLIVDPTMQVFQQSDSLNILSTGDWKAVVGTPTTTKQTQTSTTKSVVNHGAFNGPFGTQIGYTEKDTTTTTQTYGTTGQTTVLGTYQNIGNSYNLNNNYITDVSILPYIRSQEILIKAQGLLVNTPISCWFDGQNVDHNMHQPDTIELIDVSGKFKAHDVIGFTDASDNEFYPIATIIDVHDYPGTSNTRLYVTGNFHSSFYNPGVDIPTVQSVIYDKNGNISSHPAHGTPKNPKVIDVHKNGYISAVGGNFTDVTGNTLQYFSVSPAAYGPCSAAWGIWGNPKMFGPCVSRPSQLTGIPPGLFNFNVDTAGKYYVRYYADNETYGYIKINGDYIAGGGVASNTASSLNFIPSSRDVEVTLNQGINTFEIYAFSWDKPAKESVYREVSDGDCSVGCAISTKQFENWEINKTHAASGVSAKTDGKLILTTRTLFNQANTIPDMAGTLIDMPGGGTYYVGATKVSLNGVAPEIDDYYNGCTIHFTSTYVTQNTISKATDTYYRAVPSVSTANVVSYTALGCVIELDKPVNISVGYNQNLKIDTTSRYEIQGNVTSHLLGLQEGKLSQLSTDEKGCFSAIFHVPDGTFKTGDRVFRVDNRTTSSDASSATTFAQGTFTASGLSTRSQALNFGSSVSGASSTFNQTTYLTNQLLYTTTSTTKTYSPYDPVAQTFMVQKEKYPNGVFLESVDFFFESKPTTTNVPVTVSIVPTINGYPGGETLDHSIVTVNSADIKISASPHYLNPEAKTTFKFKAPVYIQPGVLYAFILKTSSTAYNVWLAAQNATAVPSTTTVKPNDPTPSTITKIGAVPGVGGLFESQNGITWTADQSKTLMMSINRCVFDTSVNPSMNFSVIQGLPYRKSTTGDIKYMLDPENTSAISNKQYNRDILCDAINITTTEFVPTGTSVSYQYKTVLNNGHTYTDFVPVTPGKLACPSADDIHLSDGLGQRVLLTNSNNSFELSASLSTSDNAVSPVISDDGLSLFNTQYIINNLQLSNTNIVLSSGGTGYNDTPNVVVSISAPDVVGGTQAVLDATVVNGVIKSVYVLNPGSGYLNTPTITFSGSNTKIATAKVITETNSHGGNATCKYFTKKVVMAAGNDSQDLRVFYTAYRPVGTNIYVFYKVLSGSDTSLFDVNDWQLMTTIGQNNNSYSLTRSDLYEFEAAPGLNGIANNYLTYTNTSGQTFNSFIQFAIKVVLTTNDNTTVPFLTDIRALALPSGTGI